MTAPIPQIKGIALANDIMAGKLPVADYPIFTASEWRLAADQALVDDHYDCLLAMVAEQEEEDREEAALRDHAYRAERNPNYAIDRALLGG